MFLLKTLLFDLIEDFDEVLYHPWRDSHLRGVSRVNYIKISLDILFMRRIKMTTEDIVLMDEVEVFYEKIITPFGTSAKVDAPKKYIGRRAYVIILKD